MGRPALSEADKLKSVRARLIQNMRPLPGSGCWAHEGQEHYKLGRERRLKPRTAMWLASGNTMPTPVYLYFVGQKDTCTADVCINPEHLEVKSNRPEKYASQLRMEQKILESGGVLRGDPPDGAVWGEGTDVIWLDLDKWEAAARAKGKDDAWIERTRPKILERAAAHRG